MYLDEDAIVFSITTEISTASNIKTGTPPLYIEFLKNNNNNLKSRHCGDFKRISTCTY